MRIFNLAKKPTVPSFEAQEPTKEPDTTQEGRGIWIPSFERGQSPEEASAAFQDTGVVILRQALNAEILENLNLLSVAGFAIMDLKQKQLANGEAAPEDALRPYVERYKQLQFMGEDVLNTLLSNSGLGSAKTFSPVVQAVGKPLKALFPGRSLTFVPSKSAIRRQSGDSRQSSYVVWHRDAHAVQTPVGECFNCWIPLQHVGTDRQSLDVVVGSHRALQRRPVNFSEIEDFSEEIVSREFGNMHSKTAVLSPGDVLLFTHHTLHRTQPMEGGKARTSCELRFALK